jgi:hypothetical protein
LIFAIFADYAIDIDAIISPPLIIDDISPLIFAFDAIAIADATLLIRRH